MPAPLRIGLAGLGTVGAGVVKIVRAHGDAIAARAGRPIEIAAISARSRHRDRGVDLAAYAWEDDPVALARRGDVDLVVEAIGGEDGPAKATAEAAIAGGKHLVTANKAMLARHGPELAAAAESSGVALRFEAAVAGGDGVAVGADDLDYARADGAEAGEADAKGRGHCGLRGCVARLISEARAARNRSRPAPGRCRDRVPGGASRCSHEYSGRTTVTTDG